MSDYISREEAYAIAKRIRDALDTTPRVLLGRTILDIIDDIPAADVRPVVRGRWEYFVEESNGLKFGRFKCSLCGKERPLKVFYGNAFNYCPNCGADMRWVDNG